ncbi:protein of unknown function [Shewanella benthica]|uniref:Uncharacterized protein n=1 Tax=Shewanella benthica TaxID=43661 RepID=A0A330M3B8_9GAMM|nr:helix-hairpin-helix domain-containing protein [Shewanella benthica]SQH75530.1 protein of unknown function [Shewanella benthica]
MKWFLDFILGRNKKNNKRQGESSVSVGQDHYIELAERNSDIVEGIMFSPVFLIGTPVEALKADGLVVKNKSDIPGHLLDMSSGTWLPKVNDKYRLGGADLVGASDAYGAKRVEYIEYVCGIKGLFNSNINILEKAELIEGFTVKHPHLKYIQSALMKYYDNCPSIMEVLIWKVGCDRADVFIFRRHQEGFLRTLDGVNVKVEAALIKEGVLTYEGMVSVNYQQILALEGVGKKTAEKIMVEVALLKDCFGEASEHS